MIEVVLASVVAFAFFGTSAAQCSSAQQIQYLLTIPNGLACGNYLAAINSTPSDAALNSACTEDCVGALSQWLAGTCNDYLLSAALIYWCQPADGGRISRCRFANESLFSSADIRSCAQFGVNPKACPGNCGVGLRGIAEEIGCCYQALYNSTMGLDGLQQAGEITNETRQFFDLLGTPALWNTCNVDIPDTCTSPPITPALTTMVMATTKMATTKKNSEMDFTAASSGIKFKISISAVFLSFIAALYTNY